MSKQQDMKPQVRVLAEALSIGLTKVARVCPTNTTLPILTNVLIQDDNGRLKLTGYNLETAIEAWIGAQVEAPISICVPAAKLLKLIKSLDSQLSLTQDRKTLVLTDGRRTMHLSGFDSEGYPPIPAPKGETASFTLDPRNLAVALDRTIFAAARYDSRPVVHAVNFAPNGRQVWLRSTDGFRGSRTFIPCTSDEKADGEANIPVLALAELARLLPKPKDIQREIGATIDEHNARFEIGWEVVLTTSLTQGTFPNLDSRIPTEFTGHATFTVADILAETRRLADFAESAYIARLSLEEDNLRMWTKAEGEGQFETSIPITLTGKPVKVALQANYLVDVLSHMNAERATLSVESPESPVLFEAEGGEFDHVIMPMNVEWD